MLTKDGIDSHEINATINAKFLDGGRKTFSARQRFVKDGGLAYVHDLLSDKIGFIHKAQ